ncbi:serine/threonine-protein kinase MPS1 isoform X2 [Vigna angularis]|uniref:serine/threonine-protein kinase MPS1 isoform X2 n=1 Tax=Phaseolus angularis TaxID=3914 RepID=UPI000809B1BC|nr:serine/threonine-protein kinase MPS1 isoform X2 [Vigna angularis]
MRHSMEENPNLSLTHDSSLSSPEFFKQVQAALKRHRPLAVNASSASTQSHTLRPKRSMVAHRNVANRSEGEPPSISDTFTGEGCKNEPSLPLESHSVGAHKKVRFSTESNNATSQPQDRASIGFNQHVKHHNMQQAESETSLLSEGGKSSLLPRRRIVTEDHLQQFKNFLSQPATLSSVVGLPCPTTTSVHSTSAPMPNSITHCANSCMDSDSHVAAEPYDNLNVNPHPITQRAVKSPYDSLKDTNRMSIDQVASAVQEYNSLNEAEMTFKHSDPSKEQQGCLLKETSKYTSCCNVMLSNTDKPAAVTNILPQGLTSSSDTKLESSRLEKQEKNASCKGPSVARKRTYDPELFFKVNGKLYQRLGKIGSGGSSEVHKVISSDCTIYALKRIKLKGRDYATAYSFCQEIEYLNRLKGKNNIIQLIDYEVTDKALFEGVMNGSSSSKDGRVKDDGYIYMVLEYGEIDLAHMLSQKWKELDGNNQTIDANWLRFYWQAVNTIHEERIVHSDLKPANFLLVKGSLKLIDFGIAKAIMSDTTNIQRDSQVGTLSYMSPEAFMCNESDASGSIMKCGRPSDIWSLGCILYQMVYGRTPFSEYKTFWAKFKVITDPNHEIMYEPVSNPWLLDLMKKCLAWDRNERWRIPQLLQHPFLVPPVPCHQSLFQDQTFKLLQLIAETCKNDPEASQLCFQLQQVLDNPIKLTSTHSLNSLDQQHKLLSRISELCIQLQKRFPNSDEE